MLGLLQGRRWIGAERLAVMGYDLEALLADLRGAPGRLRGTGSDVTRMLGGFLLGHWRQWTVNERVGARYHER